MKRVDPRDSAELAVLVNNVCASVNVQSLKNVK